MTVKAGQELKATAQWYGHEIRTRPEIWTENFTVEDRNEIGKALLEVSDLNKFDKDQFKLQRLGRKLEKIRKDLLSGTGFKLLKGLRLDQYSYEEKIKLFWGLGLYLGEAVPQNAKGHLLGHVIDLNNDPLDPLTRIYTTNYRQPYHTDSCDVVGLLCLHAAKTGGLSSIVSSTTIYTEIMRSRPDLIKVLLNHFTIDRKGEVPDGKLPYYQMAVFYPSGNEITAFYARDFIEAASRHSDVTPLSDIQIEALDMVDQMASDPALRLDMNLEAGDIQLCHNHTILHSRTGYQDYAKPGKKRHLLRIWLSQHDGRELHPDFAERYGTIKKGSKRGGIYVKNAVENIPYYPE